jgi:hypothetical protein
MSVGPGYNKCPLRIGLELLPIRSRVMCRSRTRGTGLVTRRVLQVWNNLDVSTSLTPTPGHLLSFTLMCCVKQVDKLLTHPVMSPLSTRMCGTCGNMIPEIIQLELFTTTSWDRQTVISGICAPKVVVNKIYQRLVDQTSSLWWDLITPNHVLGVYHKVHLWASSSWKKGIDQPAIGFRMSVTGSSYIHTYTPTHPPIPTQNPHHVPLLRTDKNNEFSSCDSRSPSSVHNTESSPVSTTCYGFRRWNCSSRHETVNFCERTLNDCQCFRIGTVCVSGGWGLRSPKSRPTFFHVLD